MTTSGVVSKGVVSTTPTLIEKLAATANLLRRQSIKMIYQAGSGHPGGALSAAEMVATLYFHEMRIDPRNPDWPERDRFILSKGHACAVLYAALAERGFFPVEDLQKLRRVTCHLQGHPDMRKTPGVDMTAGSLGNGLAAGLGMALGARMTQRDFHVYVMIGEGDLQEGCTWEAAMMAGFHKLGRLTLLIDYNRSQVDGEASAVLDPEPLADKWRAFGWQVRPIDGHNIGQILEALAGARDNLDIPTVVLATTHKGKGVSFMEDRPEWHGRAPSREETIAALAELGEVWQP